MKRMKLTKYERKIEQAIERGEYYRAPKEYEEEIARAIRMRRKDAVLSLRINQSLLESIKRKAKALGVPYQSFISEILHRHAA